MAGGMEIVERRDKVTKLVFEGLSSSEIAKALGVSHRQIERDRQQIRRFLIKEIREKSLEIVLSDFVLRFDGVYREARALYRKTKNESIKLGCLNLMERHEEAKIRILQSLGVLEKAAERVEIRGRNPIIDWKVVYQREVLGLGAKAKKNPGNNSEQA